jgi:hypothetical protein
MAKQTYLRTETIDPGQYIVRWIDVLRPPWRVVRFACRFPPESDYNLDVDFYVSTTPTEVYPDDGFVHHLHTWRPRYINADDTWIDLLLDAVYTGKDILHLKIYAKNNGPVSLPLTYIIEYYQAETAREIDEIRALRDTLTQELAKLRSVTERGFRYITTVAAPAVITIEGIKRYYIKDSVLKDALVEAYDWKRTYNGITADWVYYTNDRLADETIATHPALKGKEKYNAYDVLKELQTEGRFFGPGFVEDDFIPLFQLWLNQGKVIKEGAAEPDRPPKPEEELPPETATRRVYLNGIPASLNWDWPYYDWRGLPRDRNKALAIKWQLTPPPPVVE